MSADKTMQMGLEKAQAMAGQVMDHGIALNKASVDFVTETTDRQFAMARKVATVKTPQDAVALMQATATEQANAGAAFAKAIGEMTLEMYRVPFAAR